MTAGSSRDDARRDDLSPALTEAFARKVDFEVLAAERLVAPCGFAASTGDHQPSVVVIKGHVGPAEASGGSAFDGADGVAVRSGLERLGWSPERVYLAMASASDAVAAEVRHRRVRELIEALDPDLVLLTDDEARDECAAAYGVSSLPFGRVVELRGRAVLAMDGLEASLDDPARKRRVWNQFKTAKRRALY